MLEYVERLLLAQTRLAAQFESAPQPEIREDSLRAEQKGAQEQEEDSAGEKKKQNLMQREGDEARAVEVSAEGRLREMARQTMRMQSIRMQKTAREETERTKRMERAMTALQQRQTINLPAKTPDAPEGGMTGSYKQKMEVAGIASGPSQRSMQEISRFFERDARRYG